MNVVFPVFNRACVIYYNKEMDGKKGKGRGLEKKNRKEIKLASFRHGLLFNN